MMNDIDVLVFRDVEHMVERDPGFLDHLSVGLLERRFTLSDSITRETPFDSASILQSLT